MKNIDSDVVRAAIDTAGRRSTATVRDGLIAWLATHTVDNRRVMCTSINPVGGSGASSEMYTVELAGEGRAFRCILRLEPQFAVYPNARFDWQYRLADVVSRRTKARVPQFYCLEVDKKWIGAEFLLMEQIDGESAKDYPSYVTDGWLRDATSNQRRQIWTSCLRELAKLHHTTPIDGLIEWSPIRAKAGACVDCYIRYWQAFDASVSRDDWSFPTISRALRELERLRPTEESQPCVVWGDASLRNVLFRGGSVAGLVDFEFLHVGLRELDVAFFAYMDAVVAEGFQRTSRLDGFLGASENWEAYEDISSTRLSNRRFFTIMAGVYNALATTRVYQRLYKDGKVARSEVLANPAVEYLESRL